MPEWNAADYAGNSQGQFAWAFGNLSKLALHGSEAVLDIGCGDGKITAEIARRVPEGRALGIDQSDSMIALARTSHALPNLEFQIADAQTMKFANMFDAVFSNSAIHWMAEPEAVVGGIARALKSGGRVFLSMGGRGTAALVHRALDEFTSRSAWAPFLVGASSPHYFLGPEEYGPWLAAAGLIADRVELVSKPMTLANATALEGWLRTTWMTYWGRIPHERQGDFLRELTEQVRLGCETGDDSSLRMPMVNLEIAAHKR